VRESAALYAIGFTAFRRDEKIRALRNFQRAYFYNKRTPEVLVFISRLAAELNRNEVAVRYAMKMIEQQDANVGVDLLRFLADYQFSNRDYAKAALVYTELLKKVEANDLGGVVLTPTDLLRLYRDAGLVFHLAEKHRQALAAFNKYFALAKDPASLTALSQGEKDSHPKELTLYRRDAAESAMQIKDWSQAKQHFGEYTKATANPQMLDYHLARVAAAEGDYAAALVLLEKVLPRPELQREKIAPYQLLGLILKGLKRQKEFIPRLEKLAKKYNTRDNIKLQLAKEYLAANRLAEAENILRQQLRFSPSAGRLQSLLEVGWRQRNPEVCAAAMERMVLLHGNVRLADAMLLEMGRDGKFLPKLFGFLEEKVADGKANLTWSQAYLAGVLALAIEKPTKAHLYFQQVAETLAWRTVLQNPDAMYLLWVGEMLHNDKPKLAEQAAQTALRQTKAKELRPEYHSLLAESLADQQKFDEARETLAKSLELASGPRLATQMADLDYLTGKTKNLGDDYAKCIVKYQDDYTSPILRHELRTLRSKLATFYLLRDGLAKKGAQPSPLSMKLASQQYLTILDEFPDHPETLRDLAALWKKNKAHQEKAKVLERRAAKSEERR